MVIRLARAVAALAACCLFGFAPAGCAPQRVEQTGRSAQEKPVLVIDVPALHSLPFSHQKPSSGGETELFHISHPTDIASDLPRYFLWREKDTGKMWVMAAGGFAARTKWFGPFTRLGEAGIRKPPPSRTEGERE